MLYSNRFKKLPAEVRVSYIKQCRQLGATIIQAHDKQALVVLPTGAQLVINAA